MVLIGGKKWYSPLITRMIDVAITNAWILYREIYGNLSLACLDFRRFVALCHLKLSYRKIKRKYKTHGVITHIRFDGKQHWIRRADKQRKCQHTNCHKKPITYCSKCDITLCVECLQPYHSK